MTSYAKAIAYGRAFKYIEPSKPGPCTLQIKHEAINRKKEESNQQLINLAFNLGSDLLKRPDEPTIKAIMRVTAEFYDLPYNEVWSARRSPPLVLARHTAMLIAKQMTSHSIARIGRLMNNLDHTTIMHGYKKIEKRASIDATLREALDRIKRLLSPDFDENQLSMPIYSVIPVATANSRNGYNGIPWNAHEVQIITAGIENETPFYAILDNLPGRSYASVKSKIKRMISAGMQRRLRPSASFIASSINGRDD